MKWFHDLKKEKKLIININDNIIKLLFIKNK